MQRAEPVRQQFSPVGLARREVGVGLEAGKIPPNPWRDGLRPRREPVAGCEQAAIYAPKSALGHSIGAVGALEAALTVLSLRDGVIPPTLNYETPDPEIDLDVVAGEPRYGDFRYAINNSFGFGGHNVALAFGRY